MYGLLQFVQAAVAATFDLSEELRADILRQRDGCWRFSQNTVTQAPALFEKLAAKDKSELSRANQLDSAR